MLEELVAYGECLVESEDAEDENLEEAGRKRKDARVPTLMPALEAVLVPIVAVLMD